MTRHITSGDFVSSGNRTLPTLRAPRVTHKQRVLELLADGRPHPHTEGYALGVMLHSRVADLRRDGHNILAWREHDQYLYQLVGSLDAAASASDISPLPDVQSEAVVPADGAAASNEPIPGQTCLDVAA